MTLQFEACRGYKLNFYADFKRFEDQTRQGEADIECAVYHQPSADTQEDRIIIPEFMIGSQHKRVELDGKSKTKALAPFMDVTFQSQGLSSGGSTREIQFTPENLLCFTSEFSLNQLDRMPGYRVLARPLGRPKKGGIFDKLLEEAQEQRKKGLSTIVIERGVRMLFIPKPDDPLYEEDLEDLRGLSDVSLRTVLNTLNQPDLNFNAFVIQLIGVRKNGMHHYELTPKSYETVSNLEAVLRPPKR